MSLKQQYKVTAAFSMASMTDVIFLLLIFFMVTSTFVLPNVLEVNLPQSTAEKSIRPEIRVYITEDSRLYAVFENQEPKEVDADQLITFIKLAQEQNPDGYVAVYADENVTYGRLIEVLDLGARSGVKMVLATKAAPADTKPQ